MLDIAYFIDTPHLEAPFFQSEFVQSSDGKGFWPPFPFSSNDLWGKLLRTINLKNKDLNKERIEDIFGLKMREFEVKNFQLNYKRYGVSAYRDWYYNITLSIPVYENKNNNFYFGWGENPDHSEVFPSPKGGICIDINMVTETMVNRGWVLTFRGSPVFEGNAMPQQSVFELDGRKVIIYVGLRGLCLISLKII